eukprot:Skav234497  [mRNA]  locus=scaffold2015:13031:13835:- [translate_table: standard]
MPLEMSVLTLVISTLWRILAQQNCHDLGHLGASWGILGQLGAAWGTLGHLGTTSWGAQAVFIQDVTVGIPNVLGILLGLAQVVLYAYFCRKPGAREGDVLLSTSIASARDVSMPSVSRRKSYCSASLGPKKHKREPEQCVLTSCKCPRGQLCAL